MLSLRGSRACLRRASFCIKHDPFVTARMLFDTELPKPQIFENRLQSEIFDNGCVLTGEPEKAETTLPLHIVFLVQQPCAGRETTNNNAVLPGCVCAHDSEEFIKVSPLIM